MESCGARVRRASSGCEVYRPRMIADEDGSNPYSSALSGAEKRSMLKVINVVGARPNFMKVAPIVAAMKRRPTVFQPLVVHTGQHYDSAMSDSFFRDLELPQPDTHLGVGSASHAAQTAAVMERFEPVDR